MSKRKKQPIAPREVLHMKDGIVGIFCDSLSFYVDSYAESFVPFAADISVGSSTNDLDTEDVLKLWGKVDKFAIANLLSR